MDGDGTPDVMFTAHDNQPPGARYLEVHSGRDGSAILKLRDPSQAFAWQGDLLGGRDLTGDGVPDLVGRWVLNADVGIVAAFDHTGRLLYRLVGSTSTRTFTVGSGQPGGSMGWVGDIDRDGADDFTLGTYDAYLGGFGAAVLSGRTGAVLVAGIGAHPLAGIGWCADGCGDMDLDGVPDFVACNSPGSLVQVFSGRTGQTIRTWEHRVAGVVGPGDVMRSGGFDYDRDGVPDVLFRRSTGLWGEGLGIYAQSGRHGGWIHRVLFCPQSQWGGTSGSCAYASWAPIEVGRPQPGNPYPVFLFPEREYGQWQVWHQGSWHRFSRGRLRMYRGTPAGVDPYGNACTGTLPSRPQMGIGNQEGIGVRLHLSNAPPAAHVALLLGFSRTQWNGIALPASLAPLGLPDCSLYTSIDLHAKTWTGASGLGRGYASIDLPFPLRPPGQETFVLHGQWLVLDPTTRGAAASDALLWRH